MGIRPAKYYRFDCQFSLKYYFDAPNPGTPESFRKNFDETGILRYTNTFSSRTDQISFNCDCTQAETTTVLHLVLYKNTLCHLKISGSNKIFVQRKNIKRCFFQTETSLNTLRLFECSSVFQPKLAMNMCYVISVRFVVVTVRDCSILT